MATHPSSRSFNTFTIPGACIDLWPRTQQLPGCTRTLSTDGALRYVLPQICSLRVNGAWWFYSFGLWFWGVGSNGLKDLLLCELVFTLLTNCTLQCWMLMEFAQHFTCTLRLIGCIHTIYTYQHLLLNNFLLIHLYIIYIRQA